MCSLRNLQSEEATCPHFPLENEKYFEKIIRSRSFKKCNSVSVQNLEAARTPHQGLATWRSVDFGSLPELELDIHDF